jgi:hypothetical protein
MGIQAESLRKQTNKLHRDNDKLTVFYSLAPALAPRAVDFSQSRLDVNRGETNDAEPVIKRIAKSDITNSFMRGLRLDSDVFGRLGRYETRLWRQTVQIILLLNSINHNSKCYADGDSKYVQLRDLATKHRRALWPPFVTRA